MMIDHGHRQFVIAPSTACSTIHAKNPQMPHDVLTLPHSAAS
jgi:hypothetical protein